VKFPGATHRYIYVRSQRAGERVKKSITRFLTAKLKLKVNQQKSAVARPWVRKFLGFSFTNAGIRKRRIAPKAVDRFKERVRDLTSRTRGVSIERMAADLTRYLRGWIGYFGKCETPSVLEGLEQWLRRRLRSALGADCGRRCGSSGNEERCVLPSYGNEASIFSSPRKRRAALTVRGGWRTRRDFISRCPLLTSTRWGFQD
jgi:hypothetical protein